MSLPAPKFLRLPCYHHRHRHQFQEGKHYYGGLEWHKFATEFHELRPAKSEVHIVYSHTYTRTAPWFNKRGSFVRMQTSRKSGDCREYFYFQEREKFVHVQGGDCGGVVGGDGI
jgi:hypothetical protein